MKINSSDPVQIVLIGPTGSGKSSTGNTILNKNTFRSLTSTKSVTLRCQKESRLVNGRQVTVLDTPGWDCTELNQQTVKDQISQALRDLNKPYSFILVLRIASVESRDIHKMYALCEFLGSDFLAYTTILFTHSDDLKFKTLDEYLSEGNLEFKYLLRKCNNRCHCWNNKAIQSDEQVDKLLQDLKKSETTESSAGIIFNENASKCETKVTNFALIDKQTENVQVLFLGMNKAGKTSSILTLFGKKNYSKDPKGPVYTCTRSGVNLKLIEGPGFNENKTEIHDAIRESLSYCTPGPHVIIIVLKVEHFSPAIQNTMKHIHDYLGYDARNHMMILFTGKDDLDGKPIQVFVNENNELTKNVEKVQNRFLSFNNRDPSNKDQVDKLLDKIKSIIQKNNGAVYQSYTKLKF